VGSYVETVAAHESFGRTTIKSIMSEQQKVLLQGQGMDDVYRECQGFVLSLKRITMKTLSMNTR
jgi:hypothetical protein